MLNRLVDIGGEEEDHQKVRSGSLCDKTIIMRALQLPRNEVVMLYFAAVCGLELNVDFRLCEVTTTHGPGGADCGVEPAMVLRPGADSIATMGRDGMKIGFANLLLSLLGSHGPSGLHEGVFPFIGPLRTHLLALGFTGRG